MIIDSVGTVAVARLMMLCLRSVLRIGNKQHTHSVQVQKFEIKIEILTH